MRVFKPFGWDSWGLIVLSLILTGVVYWVLEFDAPEGEKQFEHTISGGIASVREIFQGFVEAGIVGFAPGTTGGSLACGFGFFLLILHLDVHANLAAILNNLRSRRTSSRSRAPRTSRTRSASRARRARGCARCIRRSTGRTTPATASAARRSSSDGVLLKYDEATETYDSGYCQNKRTCEEGESCAAGILEREDILPWSRAGTAKPP